MATWKLVPALAAGNCVVLKPAEQTPTSIMVLMDLIKDVLPPGVLNVVTGYGAEAGDALATHTKIAKIAFTGSTATGTRILHAAAENMIPTTLVRATHARASREARRDARARGVPPETRAYTRIHARGG